jgi:type II secretory pathway component GspD/PulD (secretin)
MLDVYEGVETLASFFRVINDESYDRTTGLTTPYTQSAGPYVRATPRIEADGRITVDAEVEFQDFAPGAVPNLAGTISTQGFGITNARHTVESGQSVMLAKSKSHLGNVLLTATLIRPHQEP